MLDGHTPGSQGSLSDGLAGGAVQGLTTLGGGGGGSNTGGCWDGPGSGSHCSEVCSGEGVKKLLLRPAGCNNCLLIEEFLFFRGC